MFVFKSAWYHQFDANLVKAYTKFTPPTIELVGEDKNDAHGKSPHAAKGRVAQPAESDTGAAGSKTPSTSNSDSPTQIRPRNSFAEILAAPGHLPAKSGSMSNGLFGSSSSFNFGVSTQSPSVDGPFASRLAPNNLPRSSGAKGIFGSPSKPTSSDAGFPGPFR